MDDDDYKSYYFTPPSEDGDLYITVESYPMGTVHGSCTAGQFRYGEDSYDREYPIVYFYVSEEGNSTEIDYQFYIEQFHHPIVLKQGTYSAG